MEITVKLFAMFRLGRFTAATKQYESGVTPADVAKHLNITEEELGVVMVNGRHADLGRQLCNGDTLSLFPLVGGG